MNAFRAVRAITAITLAIGCAFAASWAAEPSSAVSMGLTKTACYGSCPSYKVTIFADGHAVFEAKEDSPPQDVVTDADFSDPVAIGRHVFTIPKSEAAAILAQFRAVDFFSLKDRYDNGTVDAPVTALHFSDGGQSKDIWDNYGSKVGMPETLTAIQTDLHKRLKDSRLVRGEAGLVAILQSEKYDFRSPAAGRMLVRAISRDAAPDTISGLLDQGVPLDADWEGKSIGEWAVRAAVNSGDMSTLRLLADRGVLKRLPSAALSELAEDAPICFVDKMRALKKLGIDPAQSKQKRGVAILRRVNDCLMALKTGEMPSLVEYYLQQGADPNAPNEEGETAIFDVWDAKVLRLLIARGADANRLNNEGQSAVFSTWDEDVLVGLLAAGTKPVGQLYGRNFWVLATSKKWDKVIAWLEAHPDVKAIAQGQ